MTRIVFRTNLDMYTEDKFPNLTDIPRKGDFIEVKKFFKQYYETLKLPTRLEVVSITWKEDYVVCELWYNNQDLEFAKLAKAPVFG